MALADDAVLSAGEARTLAGAGDLLIVDVRSPAEWRRSGVPAGAAAVTIHNRGGTSAFVAEVLAAVGGDHDRPVATICATGVRSAAAQRLLEGVGFTRVYNIAEGMGGGRHGAGWLAQGLPVDPCERC